MSRGPQFQVDGQWFPIFSSAELGETEETILVAQQTAHLREARARQARRFACPDCGELNAMAPPDDRTHPAKCPKRGGAS